MLEIAILITDELDEDDLQDLLSGLRHKLKYADGVRTYSMEAIVHND